jgi:hypothetical protein
VDIMTKKTDLPVAKTKDRRLIAARKAFLKTGTKSLTVRNREVLGREVDLDHRLSEAIAAYQKVA